MLKKVYVKNISTNCIYEGYYSDDNPFNTPFFTKSIMKQIIKEANQTNKSYKCNVVFRYDKPSDKVICIDNEFHKGIQNAYNSHMLYTTYGMMKLYNFGEEILWEIMQTV